MVRPTAALPDELLQAFREAAARKGRSIGARPAKALSDYRVKLRPSTEALLRKARECSGLRENAALRLAVRETRGAR